MPSKKPLICKDHEERNGIFSHICCSDECQVLLCAFCLKAHGGHKIFSLSQLHHHREMSDNTLRQYKTEFQQKGESLFNTLSTSIQKVIEKNKEEFLKHMNGIADNISEFQRLYDDFDRYSSLNTKLIKKYTEIIPFLGRSTFQDQMEFLQDQVNDFIESTCKKINCFKQYLQKDFATDFSCMEVKRPIRVEDARGYNPHTMKHICDSLMVSGSKNGILSMWDYEKRKVYSRNTIQGEIFCLEYVNDYKTLFCGSSSALSVYNVTKTSLCKKRVLRVGSPVNNLLYVGSDMLVTTEKQYGIIIRNARNLSAIAKIKSDEVFSLAYIPSRNRLLIETARGLTYFDIRRRVPFSFTAIGDINLSSRSCHGLYYMRNEQKFVFPVNSRKIAIIKGDFNVDKKMDTQANYGFVNKPCAYITNEDESQTVMTTGTSGFILLGRDNAKFMSLDTIWKSSAVQFIKEKRVLIIADFGEDRFYILKIKSIFDAPQQNA